MPIIFYPHLEDINTGTLTERIETLMEAALHYKAIILDESQKAIAANGNDPNRHATPRELTNAYNWDEISSILHQVRDLPEGNKEDKTKKYNHLTKLAEIYEILRAAKMPKLEAVRLALINEASHLKI